MEFVLQFIANEFMIDMNEFRLYKNRLSLGITSSPYKVAKVGSFIMQEMSELSKGASWDEAYNIGLSLMFKF